MALTHLSSHTLRPLIKLIGKKEFLLAEIAKIDAQLSSILSCKPLPSGKRAGRRAGKKAPAVARKKRAARGSVQGMILKALRAAGAEGVKVVDLAKKLGVKGTNLHVWFGTTGKKHPGIKKVGKGHYRLAEK